MRTPALCFSFLLAVQLTGCNGTSMGNPPSKHFDCDEVEKYALTGEEEDFFQDETGERISVSGKIASLDGAYTSKLEWIEDELTSLTTGITITLLTQNVATLVESGPEDNPRCHDRKVSFPVQITIETEDGVLSTSSALMGSLDEGGYFWSDLRQPLDNFPALSEKFSDLDEELEVSLWLNMTPEGMIEGDVFVQSTSITHETSSLRQRNVIVARFPAAE